MPRRSARRWRRSRARDRRLRDASHASENPHDARASSTARPSRRICARKSRPKCGGCARARSGAGPRGGAGRRESGERGLRALEGEADRRSRDEIVRPPAARHRVRRRAAGAGREAQCRSGSARHSGAASAAEADRQPEGARTRSIRARTWTAFIRSMPAGLRPDCRRSTPCTPLGCVMLAKTVHAIARRHGGRHRRPLQYRRQAADPAAAQRERHRDGRAFEDARSSRPSAAAPMSCSPRSAGPRWCAAIGSSPARP